MVTGVANRFVVAIRRTNQEGYGLDLTTQRQLFKFIGKRTGAQALAAFIEGNPEATLRTLQQAGGNLVAAPRLDRDKFISAEAGQAFQILVHARSGVSERGFSGDDEADVHGVRTSLPDPRPRANFNRV